MVTAAEIPPASRPTVAVALSHDGRARSLPKIVASGRGVLAEQILALAAEHNIRVREDADLVEVLATLDLDTPIPSGAIIAVAEILTRVYAANQQLDRLAPSLSLAPAPSEEL
jgi:flagellar biosynthesis protein